MPKIKFKNTGEEVEVEAGASLMEVSRNKSWPIAFGCEDGVCGTCIVKVIEGGENLGKVEEHEKQTLDMMGMDDGQYRLACQCRINGDATIEGM